MDLRCLNGSIPAHQSECSNFKVHHVVGGEHQAHHHQLIVDAHHLHRHSLLFVREMIEIGIVSTFFPPTPQLYSFEIRKGHKHKNIKTRIMWSTGPRRGFNAGTEQFFGSE